MLGRRRAAALQERINRLEAQASVATVLFSALAVSLRAAPDDVRNEIFRSLRASVSGGAPGSELEREVLEIEELVAQIIDEIEAVARGGDAISNEAG